MSERLAILGGSKAVTADTHEQWLWGKGHPGPANVPLPRYGPGYCPVTDGLAGRVLSMTGSIEAAPGAVQQIGAAIRKVAEHCGEVPRSA